MESKNTLVYSLSEAAANGRLDSDFRLIYLIDPIQIMMQTLGQLIEEASYG